jgi:hypothetical protein
MCGFGDVSYGPSLKTSGLQGYEFGFRHDARDSFSGKMQARPRFLLLELHLRTNSMPVPEINPPVNTPWAGRAPTIACLIASRGKSTVASAHYWKRGKHCAQVQPARRTNWLFYRNDDARYGGVGIVTGFRRGTKIATAAE